MKFSHLGWTTNCLTKAPTHEKTFWVVGQDDPRDSPNHYRPLLLCLGGSTRGSEVPVAEEVMYFECRVQRPWAGSELNASSLKTSFHIPQSTMKVSKGRKQPIVLSLCDAYEHQQWQAWHDNSKNPVGDTHILALINIFLDGLKAWSTIAESWMVLET